jgi:predicted GNAT family acetyltransferase
MSTMSDIRILDPGDEPALEAFLLPRVESSMFLIGNMRAVGLQDRGQRYGGTYAAAFEGQRIVGAVAHYWNGNLVTQAPVHLIALARAALDASKRPLRGLIGPTEQVSALKAGLGVDPSRVQLDESEKLYRLMLEDLVVPDALRSGEVQARRIESRDLDLMVEWRIDFAHEALGEVDSPELWEQARSGMERMMEDGLTWVLETAGVSVSTSSFNTAIAEAVQVGGVWTPPELRCRGYGRAVVAASLLDAWEEGAVMAILFTPEGNLPAQRAYEALGFCHVGHYGLLLLR